MIIRFSVGHAERHEVIFELRAMLESLMVTIDGEPTIWDFRLLPILPLRWVKTNGLATNFCLSDPPFTRFIHYAFTVGRDELHKVRIQHETNPWVGHLRNERFRVYVDNSLIEEHEG